MANKNSKRNKDQEWFDYFKKLIDEEPKRWSGITVFVWKIPNSAVLKKLQAHYGKQGWDVTFASGKGDYWFSLRAKPPR